jgi:hypothetical protein
MCIKHPEEEYLKYCTRDKKPLCFDCMYEHPQDHPGEH